MNESSLPCGQRRITFNDDGQRVQLARPELPAPQYICKYRLLSTTPPWPSRHYYPRLISSTNLPTLQGWIAWLAKADCTHIQHLPKVITRLNPKAPDGNEPRLSGPWPTQYSEPTAPYIIGRELNLRALPGRQWESNPQPSEKPSAWGML